MDVKSKEFKKLQAKWYKKAADSGFKDIDPTDDKEIKSKRSKNELKDGILSGSMWETDTAKYYYAVSCYLNECDWSKWPKGYREVWELYGEGKTMTEIADARRVKSAVGIWQQIQKMKKDMIANLKEQRNEEEE